MRITESVSFWLVIIGLIIGFAVGVWLHWIIGVIVFFVLVGKTAIIGLVLDTVSSSLEYHHDRQDERARKSIASLMLIKAARSGARPTTMRIKKL